MKTRDSIKANLKRLKLKLRKSLRRAYTEMKYISKQVRRKVKITVKETKEILMPRWKTELNKILRNIDDELLPAEQLLSSVMKYTDGDIAGVIRYIVKMLKKKGLVVCISEDGRAFISRKPHKEYITIPLGG